MSGVSEDKIATIVDRVVHRLNANEPGRRPAPATIAPSGECGPKRSSPSRLTTRRFERPSVGVGSTRAGLGVWYDR